MSKCGVGPVHVVQMTPCTDVQWRAVFADPSTPKGYYVEPVACWLLVEHDGEHHVHPACAIATVVSDATRIDSYLGVASPGSDADLVFKAFKIAA